jgi:hypothetical protein
VVRRSHGIFLGGLSSQALTPYAAPALGAIRMPAWLAAGQRGRRARPESGKPKKEG